MESASSQLTASCKPWKLPAEQALTCCPREEPKQAEKGIAILPSLKQLPLLLISLRDQAVDCAQVVVLAKDPILFQPELFTHINVRLRTDSPEE